MGQEKRIKNPLILIVLCLVAMGVIAIFDASAFIANERYNDSFLFLKSHLVKLFFGLLFMILFSKIDYHKLIKLSKPFYFFTLIMLIIILIPGLSFVKKINGSRRWIDTGFFLFQPSEFMKLSLVLYLTSFLVRKKELLRELKIGFFPPFVLFVCAFIVIVLEPDLGTAMIIFVIFYLLMILGGSRIYHLSATILLSFPAVLCIIYTSAYRKARILAFLYPESYSSSMSYQIYQSLIALGNGGFSGLGAGMSRQKLFFLPNPHTDFIFSIIGEEFGYLGSIFIIVLFILFTICGLKIGLKAVDDHGYYLALGITGMITVNAILHIGVCSATLPTTGITLPFISYGGSSLLISLVGVGILLNIHRFTLKNFMPKLKGKDR